MKYTDVISQEFQRVYGEKTDDLTLLRFFANLSFAFAVEAERGTVFSEQVVRGLVAKAVAAEKHLASTN